MTGATSGAVTTGAATTGAATVHLVPHTHWDREWYEPFQRFRLRLVDLGGKVVGFVGGGLRTRYRTPNEISIGILRQT